MRKDQIGIVAGIALIAFIFFGYAAYIIIDNKEVNEKDVSSEKEVSTSFEKEPFEVPDIEDIRTQYEKKIDAYKSNGEEDDEIVPEISPETLNGKSDILMAPELENGAYLKGDTDMDNDKEIDQDKVKIAKTYPDVSLQNTMGTSRKEEVSKDISDAGDPITWQEAGFVRRRGAYGNDPASDLTPVEKKEGVGDDISRKDLTQIEEREMSCKAYVYGDHIVKQGGKMKFRLSSPLMLDGKKIPAGTFAHGISRLQGDRLLVEIKSLVTVGGDQYNVTFDTYDIDGLQGLYIPSKAGQEAGREVANGALSASAPALNLPIIGRVGINLGRKRANEQSIRVGNKYKVILKEKS